MNFRVVRLIGIDIWQAGENSQQEYITLYNKYPEGPSLHTYRSVGAISGSMHLKEVDCQVPDFWTDKVSATYLALGPSTGDIIEEYHTWISIVELQPDTLRMIVDEASNDGPEYCMRLDALFEVIFPNLPGKRVSSFLGNWPRFISILYLEPEVSLNLDAKDSLDHIRQVAEEIRSVLKRNMSVRLPHFLLDTLLLDGLGPTGQDEQGTALSFEALRIKSFKGSLVLPRTVTDLIEYMTYVKICRHLRKRLTKLPFYTQNIDQYIEKLRLGMDQFFGYEEFLKDRQKVFKERLTITHLTGKIHRELENNLISLASRLERSVPIDTVSIDSSDDPYRYHRRYHLLESLTDKLAKTDREIQENLEMIVSRENILADYLKDRTNLKLQRSIEQLTWAIAVITVVAPVITFLPEDSKQLIYNTTTVPTFRL